jgi:hypothetical protein
VTHHVDHDLDNRSHAGYHHSETNDSDRRPCAANQREHKEGDKHDESRQVKPHCYDLTDCYLSKGQNTPQVTAIGECSIRSSSPPSNAFGLKDLDPLQTAFELHD